MILAKVTGPLMSFDASGKFANLVNYKWKEFDIVRSYVSSNPSNTEKQKENRDLFGAASKYYNLLTDYDREAWNRIAGRGVTGHNVLTKLARNSLKETGNFALVHNLYIDNLVPEKARINFNVTADIDLKLTLTDIKNDKIKTYSLKARKNQLNSFTLSNLNAESDYSFIFKSEQVLSNPPGKLIQIGDVTTGDYFINYGLVCLDNKGEESLIHHRVELDNDKIDENNPIKLEYQGLKTFDKFYLYRLNNNLGLNEGLIAKAIPPQIVFNDSGRQAIKKFPGIKSNEMIITGFSGLYSFESF